jgi:hypothetical protein
MSLKEEVKALAATVWGRAREAASRALVYQKASSGRGEPEGRTLARSSRRSRKTKQKPARKVARRRSATKKR